MTDFFKGSEFVVQFFEDVRRNDFCAELIVFILSITNDVFCDVHISIWPVEFVFGISQGSYFDVSPSSSGA